VHSCLPDCLLVAQSWLIGMPSTKGIVFVDTYILIYAHDKDAGIRWQRASHALDQLWETRAGRLSIHVRQMVRAEVPAIILATHARRTAGQRDLADCA
jgi:hypothetical protein